MLLCLSTSIERAFKVVNINHQNCIVCLSCTSDHVRYEVSMARRVQKYDVLVLNSYFTNTNIDCNSPCPFLLSRVGHPSIFKALFTCLFGFFSISMNLLSIQVGSILHKHPQKSRLARVHMADNNDIDSVRGGLTAFTQRRVFIVVVVYSVLLYCLRVLAHRFILRALSARLTIYILIL